MAGALGLISAALSLACAYALYTLVAAGQGAFPWGTSLLLSVLILCLSLALLQLPPPLPPLLPTGQTATKSTTPAILNKAPEGKVTANQKSLTHPELVTAFEPLIRALPVERQETLAALKERFQTLTNETEQPAGPQAEAPWSVVVSHTTSRPGSIFRLQIEQLKGHDFTFRIFVDVDGTPEETFDLMSDITKRADWDELTEKAGTIEQWDSMSAVQFMITKGIWPAAPREALVSGYILPLKESDRTYFNVTTDHPEHAGLESRKGDVRMHIKIAGQKISPHPTQKGCARVVQLVDGDLGGWLPKSIVSIVTTQALPTSMKRVNKLLLQDKAGRQVSLLMMKALGRPVDAEPSAADDATIKESSSDGSNKEAGSALVVTRQSTRVAVQTHSKFTTVLRLLKQSQPLVILALVYALLFRRR